jgi:hypothetical protein
MAQGDQIYVYRELFNFRGVYEHHGIDCGDGTVIHYRKPSETIERTSWAIFSRDNSVYIQNYPQGFCFIADIVVERAKSRLGEQKYNILFNNCEHFATWCKTGISESKQIRDFLPGISHSQPSQLSEYLQKAQNAEKLLQGALGDIRMVWDEIQPRYKTVLKEMDIYDKIAKQAVKNNRDDLAREALKRKLQYKKQATELKEQLNQLATITEDILRKLVNF